MALSLNIDDLIHQRKVEGARIEYKRDWNPEKVLHSVCAFANDIDNWGGGYIILGVEEKDGQPVLPPKGIRKKSVDAVIKELLKADAEKSIPARAVKTTEKTVVKPGSKSEGIVKNLTANPFATRKDLAEATGLSIRGVEWNLKALTRAGVIRRVGPDKGGHWEVNGQA